MYPGEQSGWERLECLDTETVCRKAGVSFDAVEKQYVLGSFGVQMYVSVHEKRITCKEDRYGLITQKLWQHAGLAYLWYLINADDIPLTGELVRPGNLRGGGLFTKGTHVLPLNALAGKYNDDIEGFFRRGKMLHAEAARYGDAALRLFPVPRIPVTIILWRGDGEFPTRSDLLFDSSCEFQSPVDILWSIAMMSVMIMM